MSEVQKIKIDPNFANEVYKLENGRYVALCMQCGMCALTCATRHLMDYSPRRLFAMIRYGMKDEVLKAKTPWFCTTCCMCKVRCPRGIPIVDVMHDIKYLIINSNVSTLPQALFYKASYNEIAKRGRIFEGGVAMNFFIGQYGLVGAAKKALAMKDLGMTMLKHKRMSLFPPKSIKGMGELKKIVAHAQAQVGKGGDVKR